MASKQHPGSSDCKNVFIKRTILLSARRSGTEALANQILSAVKIYDHWGAVSLLENQWCIFIV